MKNVDIAEDKYYIDCLVFFFKQKTAYELRISDWSSDVCSSDLTPVKVVVAWDALSVGDAGAPISEGYLAVPRVPALSLMSEYVSPAGSSAANIATTAAPYQIGRAHV